MATLTATELLNCNFIPGFIPAGTITAAENATAPTSWTKLTTHNNKALRVVTGTVSSGGTLAFTSAFPGTKAVQGSLQPRTTGFTVSPAPAAVSIAAANAVFPAGATGGFSITDPTLPSHTHTYTRNKTETANPGPVGTLSATLGNRNSSIVGSSDSHNHAVSVSPHTHTISNQLHAHGISDPGHTHTFTGTAQNFAVNYVDIILIQKN
jgi:hypothetical protein